MAAPMLKSRVIEFYSGIGGMHYALKASGLDASVVAAIDINDLANDVYRHNFPNVNLLQRNIQSLSVDEFVNLDGDIFLMSPPCQPFTRVGLKGDSNDPRSQSFLHLLQILPILPKMPKFILVENVKGFEVSNTRDHLVKTLKACDYIYQEFLLSPTHFGIPNQRLRYFLVAKKHPLVFKPVNISSSEHQALLRQQIGGSCRHESWTLRPKLNQEIGPESPQSQSDLDSKTEINIKRCHYQDSGKISDETGSRPRGSDSNIASLNSRCSHRTSAAENCRHSTQELNTLLNCSDSLEDLSGKEMEELMVPDKLLVRFARIIDVVQPDDRNTRCFTKAYGHYVEGTGSLLQTNTGIQGMLLLKNCDQNFETISEEYLEKLRNLKIRYFSAREIANLQNFPKTFAFPKDLSRKQQYRVLGNSLNIHVVSVLLKYLVTEHACDVT